MGEAPDGAVGLSLTIRKIVAPLLFAAGLAGALWLAMNLGLSGFEDGGDSAGVVLPEAAAQLLAPGQKATFVELGSVGCKPCEAMKPVMEAVRQKYGERVEVVFHDVRKDPEMAGRYRIRLIPTQVFLMPDGTEFFRHEGYLPLDQVREVIRRMGVR